MYQISSDFGLKQLIREPTRGDYLLDLCMSDIHDSKAQNLPAIAEHKALLIHLSVDAPVVKEMPRSTGISEAPPGVI